MSLIYRDSADSVFYSNAPNTHTCQLFKVQPNVCLNKWCKFIYLSRWSFIVLSFLLVTGKYLNGLFSQGELLCFAFFFSQLDYS